MSIIKCTPEICQAENRSYTTIQNEVLDLIQDELALSIFIYMQSKPENWIPRMTDLMKRWGRGRDRTQKAINHLKALGLWHVKTVHDEKGHFQEKKVVVLYRAKAAETKGSNRSPEKPSDGKSGDIVIKDCLLTTTKLVDNSKEKPPTEFNLSKIFTDQSKNIPLEHLADQFKKWQDMNSLKKFTLQHAVNSWRGWASMFDINKINRQHQSTSQPTPVTPPDPKQLLENAFSQVRSFPTKHDMPEWMQNVFKDALYHNAINKPDNLELLHAKGF